MRYWPILLVIAALAAALLYGAANKAAPTHIEYASYEDCILGKLGRGQSKIASQAIIDACRAKYSAPVRHEKPGKQRAGAADAENPYMALVPEDQRRINSLWDGFHDRGETKFRGYVCRDDCSGHIAGYEWAEARGIEYAEDCDGNSDSFIEGCQAFAEEVE